MTWQQKPNLDYEYLANGQPVAALTWVGNLWSCTARASSGDLRTTTEVHLSKAQAWAEGVIQ
jgi:hypothetical protein